MKYYNLTRQWWDGGGGEGSFFLRLCGGRGWILGILVDERIWYGETHAQSKLSMHFCWQVTMKLQKLINPMMMEHINKFNKEQPDPNQSSTLVFVFFATRIYKQNKNHKLQNVMTWVYVEFPEDRFYKGKMPCCEKSRWLKGKYIFKWWNLVFGLFFCSICSFGVYVLKPSF